MPFGLLADLVLIQHYAFNAFAVLGALAWLRWRFAPLVHLPALAWGVAIELMHGTCPLTPLENYFAARAGREGYEGSFIEHYLVPIIYPDGLTRTAQLTLAGLVVGINLAIYAWSPVRRLAGRWHRASSGSSHS